MQATIYVEAENLLAKHPKVLMVAGIEIPNSVLCEAGRYYIIPKENTQPTDEDLISFCKEHLTNYKTPRQFVFRNKLPLTPAGKVMKSKLKQEYEETGE